MKNKEITFKEYTNLFMNFLKQFSCPVKDAEEKNALKSFKHNVITRAFQTNQSDAMYALFNPLATKNMHRCLFQESCALEIINFAFTWSHTKEGHEFWETLSNQWAKYIHKILN